MRESPSPFGLVLRNRWEEIRREWSQATAHVDEMAHSELRLHELLGRCSESFDAAAESALAAVEIRECVDGLANLLGADLERACDELHALRRAVLAAWRRDANARAEPIERFHRCLDSAIDVVAARLVARERHLAEAIERLDHSALVTTGLDALLHSALVVWSESSPRIEGVAVFLPKSGGLELIAQRGLSETQTQSLSSCALPSRVASMRTAIEWPEGEIRVEAAQLLSLSPPLRALYGVPLSLDGNAFGAALACSAVRAFSPWERSTFTALVHGAATAVRAQLAERDRAFQRGALLGAMRGVPYAFDAERRSLPGQPDLLAMVAHDLRGPLSAILMSASALDRFGGSDAARQHQALRTIRRGVARMERMIGDLLDLTSIQAGRLRLDKRKASVGAMVLEVQASVAASAKEGQVRLEVDVDAAAECHVDVDRIEQVLTNLLGNAIKFARPGDGVAIRGGARDEEVYFDVVDTGPGIPSDDLEHVFEPFWSGEKHRSKGTGLGLYISKEIVEEHGGRIWIDSTPGMGTSVHVRLPQWAG
jgi:signal transduction histidine kinase